MDSVVYNDSNLALVDYCICVAKGLSEESMYGKPTDIIGFSDIGQQLAAKLEEAVGIKEICYYDIELKNSRYHYLDFKDMLKSTEYMFITCPNTPEHLALFDDLSTLNTNCKVIIVSSGFESVARKIAKIVGKEKVRII